MKEDIQMEKNIRKLCASSGMSLGIQTQRDAPLDTY